MIEPLAPIELSEPRFETEGLRHVTAASRALGRRADLTVWAPAETPDESGPAAPLPLVVLLHGVYGSHWAWAWKAGAHRTAADLVGTAAIPPIALAMPSDGLFGLGSGYVRHSAGNFAEWILDEVPWLAAQAVCGVDPDAPIALVGLSMGGFGALILAARNSDRVFAASGMSSITDFSQMRYFVGDISGYDVNADDRSVLQALLAASKSGRTPPIRIDCGSEDPLIAPNRELHLQLTAAGIAHEWEEPGGGHEWPYWEAQLPQALRFVAGHTPGPRPID